MTQEGLENLKAVARKAIELQVSATLVMATLQRIYLDEEDELDQDAEEYLRSATASAMDGLNYAMGTLNQIQKAYEIEKNLADLGKQLESIQDNDTARTRETQGARA